MVKKILIYGSITLAVIALITFNKLVSGKDNENLFTEVSKGLFEITVSNAGELLAEKSLDIYGPQLGVVQNQQQQGQQSSQQGGQTRQQGSSEQSGGQQSSGQQSGGQGGQTGGQTSTQTGGQTGGQRTGGSGGSTGGMTGGMQSRGQMGGDIRIQEFKITDIVPEGTIVKAGDYIAQLDRSSYENTLRDALTTLTTYRTNVEMKILDTAMNLSSLRDEIKNLRFQVEEAKITLDQSKFEPPATIRKAEMELNRAERALEQRIKSYELRKLQNLTDIEKQKTTLARHERYVQDLQDFLAQFRITAPADGMVIYKKDRLGNKVKTGSQLHPFDMVVATLPDLTSMITKTYVNEVEVSKVEAGQQVSITVDAIPGKSYTGKIISVANIGETLPNSDAKMFEVQVRIEGTDMMLRPGMTTWNKIVIKSIDNAVFIPLESVQAGADSVPYVYKKNKTRQIVVLGEANEKTVIVKEGLTPGTMIYLSQPAEAETFRLVGEELVASYRR